MLIALHDFDHLFHVKFDSDVVDFPSGFVQSNIQPFTLNIDLLDLCIFFFQKLLQIFNFVIRDLVGRQQDC